MKRVVLLGRGGSGESTLAARLGAITGLPVIELDRYFWRPGLEATPPDQWAAVQGELVRDEAWIMDGDLGPYDVTHVRLAAIATHAGDAEVHVIRNPRALTRFVAQVATGQTP